MNSPWIRRLFRVLIAMALSMVMTAAPSTAAGQKSTAVVEHLRLSVPIDQKEIWLRAEMSSWQPWLEQQSGFLHRDLYWDPQVQEAVLLIYWASREQWKAITPDAVDQVQQHFDQLVRDELGTNDQHPFALVYSGELMPVCLP